MSFTQTEINQSQVDVIETLIISRRNLIKVLIVMSEENKFYFEPSYFIILLEKILVAVLFFILFEKVQYTSIPSLKDLIICSQRAIY